MPLKLNVGLSRKIGLPGYGSLGASCHVELEVDGAALGSDADGFHQQVECAFSACRQAVQGELARHEGAQQTTDVRKRSGFPAVAERCRRQVQTRSRTPSASKRATANEVRHVKTMVNRIEGPDGAGVDNLTRRMFGKELAQLSGLEVKGLIATLQEMDAGNIRPSNAARGATS